MNKKKNIRSEIPDSKISESEIPDDGPRSLEELERYRESLPPTVRRRRGGPLPALALKEKLARVNRWTEELGQREGDVTDQPTIHPFPNSTDSRKDQD